MNGPELPRPQKQPRSDNNSQCRLQICREKRYGRTESGYSAYDISKFRFSLMFEHDLFRKPLSPRITSGAGFFGIML